MTSGSPFIFLNLNQVLLWWECAVPVCRYVSLLLCSVIQYRSSTFWVLLPPVTIFKQKAWRTNELSVTFLRPSEVTHASPCTDTHAIQCVCFLSSDEGHANRQQRTLWTPVIHNNYPHVFAGSVFTDMASYIMPLSFHWIQIIDPKWIERKLE